MDNHIKLLIKKHLPAHLHEKANSLRISQEHLTHMTELVILILESKSIDTDTEKQSRLDLLALMKEEQKTKLHDILTREKEKIAAIERKYEEKKIEIKKKYLLKRQNMGYQKTISTIKSRESQTREQEHEEADNLLNAL
jgi:hypothetical protein